MADNTPHDTKEPSLALRALLQVGLGCLLTAALLPLLYLAGQLGGSLSLKLHTHALDPVVTLLVFALGGLFAARLSATLAHRPWDGLGACAVATALGGGQLLVAQRPQDWLGVALWPAGLVLGCVAAAGLIQRCRRDAPNAPREGSAP